VLHLHHTPQGEAYVNIELVPVRDASGEQAYFVEKMEPLRTAQGQPAAQGLIGRSAAFQHMLGLVARVGPSGASVLLQGESGTGKELVAQAVHEASPRAAKPLVVVDCASLPEALFESELFGHERGAFTSAHSSKPGLVEAANGGSLFLDEVGDIPLSMQVKLLRLLESGTYRRVGSTELRRVDLRVVSATHRDLPAMVADGRFRQDLYYRLSTFPIALPALRDRAEDIALLAVAMLARVTPGRRLALSKEAMSLLQRYPFPGNVRELRNVLERASLLADGDTLEPAHVQGALGDSALPGTPTAAGILERLPTGMGAADDASLRGVARAALQAQLKAHRGSRSELARKLGISERSLYRKLKQLALEPPG
jgi:DNA-binding NtrC family response regulator